MKFHLQMVHLGLVPLIEKLTALITFFTGKGHPAIVVFNYGSTFKGAYDDVEKAGEAIMKEPSNQEGSTTRLKSTTMTARRNFSVSEGLGSRGWRPWCFIHEFPRDAHKHGEVLNL